MYLYKKILMKNLINEINTFHEAVSYMSTRTEEGNRLPLIHGMPFDSVDTLSPQILKFITKNLDNGKINLILPKKDN